jgi:hypothetical protein
MNAQVAQRNQLAAQASAQRSAASEAASETALEAAAQAKQDRRHAIIMQMIQNNRWQAQQQQENLLATQRALSAAQGTHCSTTYGGGIADTNCH